MDDNKHNLICPECQNTIEGLDQEIVVGDIVECPHCGSELRIISFDGETTNVEVIEEEK